MNVIEKRKWQCGFLKKQSLYFSSPIYLIILKKKVDFLHSVRSQGTRTALWVVQHSQIIRKAKQ